MPPDISKVFILTWIIFYFNVNHPCCQDPCLKSCDDGWQDLKGLNHTTIRLPPTTTTATVSWLDIPKGKNWRGKFIRTYIRLCGAYSTRKVTIRNIIVQELSLMSCSAWWARIRLAQKGNSEHFWHLDQMWNSWRSWGCWSWSWAFLVPWGWKIGVIFQIAETTSCKSVAKDS